MRVAADVFGIRQTERSRRRGMTFGAAHAIVALSSAGRNARRYRSITSASGARHTSRRRRFRGVEPGDAAVGGNTPKPNAQQQRAAM